MGSYLSEGPDLPFVWVSLSASFPPPPSAAESLPEPLTPPSTVSLHALGASSKRRIVDEHDRAARAERKRRRHLAIDLSRRQREATAIQRLKQILPRADGRLSDDSRHSEERKDKVSVLEQAAQQLGELRQRVAQLTHSNNAQHDQLNAVRFQLQQTQSAVTRMDEEARSHSLYSSAFLSNSQCLLLVSVGTGVALDVNARLLQAAGWERQHVLGRLLTVPYKHLMNPGVSTSSERHYFRQHRVLVESKETKQMVPAQPARQYKSGQEAIADVASGRRKQHWAVFRLYVRSGELCDIPGTCWAGESEEVEDQDAAGLQYRRPKHIIFALSFREAVVMD